MNVCKLVCFLFKQFKRESHAFYGVWICNPDAVFIQQRFYFIHFGNGSEALPRNATTPFTWMSDMR